uniref:hypothetical protein n=1 Tax=Enterobacteriaceae TaxID=543 RepID=UPI0015EE4DE3|nr:MULTISPECIES: hypothetical protein [Enterobacteriaceae]
MSDQLRPGQARRTSEDSFMAFDALLSPISHLYVRPDARRNGISCSDRAYRQK